MKLQELIKKDLSEAMKAKDTKKLSLLRLVVSEFNRVGKELSDEEVTKELRRMVKDLNVNIHALLSYEQTDNIIKKIQKNQYEIDILEKYLPKMLGDNQIKIIISNIISDNNFSGMKDMGKVMSKLNSLENSKLIDNRKASVYVKEILNK